MIRILGLIFVVVEPPLPPPPCWAVVPTMGAARSARAGAESFIVALSFAFVFCEEVVVVLFVFVVLMHAVRGL